MIKFNNFIIVLVLTCLSLLVEANTLQNNFDQLKTADMDEIQWLSLENAIEEVKLLPSVGVAVNHNFGSSVSGDGDRMVVGAPNFSLNSINHGAVYVFDFDGTLWSESQIITPFDGNNDDLFGVSVSLSGDRLLIGASYDDDENTDAGVVFVYDLDEMGWQFTQKLIADDAGFGFHFGNSISLSGNRVLIGSDGHSGVFTGAAYIFDFGGTNWNQTTKITADDGAAGNLFGISVSLSGNRALIGARFGEGNVNNSGAAYIFDFDEFTWDQTSKINADDGATNDGFGTSVSLSGNRALLGAQSDGDNGSSSGSAYVFDFDETNWNQTTKITPDDGAAVDLFGISVSLSGDQALIAAPFDDDNNSASGSVYLFDFDGNNWNQTNKIIPTDGAINDNFGNSVSLSNNRALIGARLDDDRGDDSGSAYIFTNINDLIFKNGFE